MNSTIRRNSQTCLPQTAHYTSQRWSRYTSELVGPEPSNPGVHLLSSTDKANALAAAHANNEDHLRTHCPLNDLAELFWFASCFRLRQRSQFTKFRVAFAIALHLALALPCNCCHDPFIVRSTQTCPPIHWFQLACTSVSMFTINVDNCLFLCS